MGFPCKFCFLKCSTTDPLIPLHGRQCRKHISSPPASVLLRNTTNFAKSNEIASEFAGHRCCSSGKGSCWAPQHQWASTCRKEEALRALEGSTSCFIQSSPVSCGPRTTLGITVYLILLFQGCRQSIPATLLSWLGTGKKKMLRLLICFANAPFFIFPRKPTIGFVVEIAWVFRGREESRTWQQ